MVGSEQKVPTADSAVWGRVRGALISSDRAIIRGADLSGVASDLLLGELDLGIFCYYAGGPVNHKATFWVETWRQGERARGHSRTYWRIRPEDEGFEGHFQFSMWDSGAKFRS